MSDFLKMSPEALELQLYKKSLNWLRAMYRALVKFKMEDIYNKFNLNYEDHRRIVFDLERKETILKRELQRRGWVDLYDAEERKDYAEAEQKMRKKKRLF